MTDEEAISDGIDAPCTKTVTKAGQPKHPPYLAGNLRPQPWSAP